MSVARVTIARVQELRLRKDRTGGDSGVRRYSWRVAPSISPVETTP